MKCVLQRVSSAGVRVDGEQVAAIEAGILAFIGVVPDDGPDDLAYVADRLVNLRVFADDDGRMNLSVQQVRGSLLLVSQFTLAADTRRGRRPSFTAAAPPERAEHLFEELAAVLRAGPVPVETGVFGASMEVELVNDGPVTLLIDSADRRRSSSPPEAGAA